jgi:hypothetical protein
MTEIRQRVRSSARQGLSVPEIERQLDVRLTETERELLLRIARQEVDSARRAGFTEPSLE